ncbi:hypothetical protein EIP86_006036 [Pleurotus ostreatoroseus]|nr:hypothetical protein EIP86_006036 [Pleurotus ostreatoroseus]
MHRLHEAGIEVFELDVTHADSIASIRKRIEYLTGGTLNILVNNAGQSYPQAVSDTSLAKAKEIFDVNLFGALAMVQAFLPLLRASHRGRIIQMGSLSGVIPTPFGVAYNTSKAALHSLSDTLRVELAPFNIKVLNVVLGSVRTHITKSFHHLPDNSIYLPIRDIYQARRIEHFHDGALPRQSIADAIVAEASKDDPRAWWWGGKNAWITWFLLVFTSRRFIVSTYYHLSEISYLKEIQDRILSRIFGLSKLTAINAREKSA